MTKIQKLVISGVMTAVPLVAYADAADRFALFEAGVLAVEDRCDDYYALVDATIGSNLTNEEYERAKSQLQVLRPRIAKTLAHMSCEEAAEAVAEMGGLPYLKVWERR